LDYVVILAAGIAVAASVVLGFVLVRYRQVAIELEKSSSLAKDVWSSMNSRFMVTDARVIDLMAKVEVLSERMKPTQQRNMPIVQNQREVVTPHLAKDVTPDEHEGRETERRILEALSTGPKTSGQIRDVIGRSREHTARLLKTLFEQEFVIRNAANKPYVYEITDKGKNYLGT
jgi:predicted transcriptional regulator